MLAQEQPAGYRLMVREWHFSDRRLDGTMMSPREIAEMRQIASLLSFPFLGGAYLVLVGPTPGDFKVLHLNRVGVSIGAVA